ANAFVIGSNTITASATATHTTCGDNNGSATASGSNGSGAYTYEWSTGSTSATISNLAAGTYSVTVTDVNSGCMASSSVFVSPSNLISSVVTTSNGTCGTNSGSATATGINGSGNYSYVWSNGGLTSTISGLGAGTYGVTITDLVSGCITTNQAVIHPSTAISCSVQGANTSCGLNNGTATVSTFNGTGAYTYSWSNGGSTETITDLTPGTYTVTVTDANTGCATTCHVTILGSTPLSCNANSTNTSCGLSNGTASVSVSNGSGNYSYTWNTGMNTQSISNLAAGTYSVTVVDNLTGCLTSCNINVNASHPITCSVSSTDSNCGLSNGTATVNPANGSGSYSYSWSNGQSTQTISGLTAGTYSVTVIDNVSNCITTCSTVVGTSVDLVCTASSSPTSCGLSNGSASVSVINGSGNYTYTWSNGGITQTINNLAAGNYTVMVTDNVTGCSTTCSTSVQSSAGISCNINATNASCGLSNGTATVNVTNGTGNYAYSWSNGNTSQTVTGLAAGTYSVTVTDLASGCVTTCSTTIFGSNAISCNASSTNASCGLSNGTATVQVFNGSGNYNYTWSNGQNTQTITGLSSGTYTVTVVDVTSGCITHCSTSLTSGSLPVCSVTTTPSSCSEANGTATVIVGGGTGSYSYLWSNGQTTTSISGLDVGSYSVTVTDSAGCSTTCTGTVTGSTSISCEVVTTQESCGLNNGTASVIVTGGSGVYSYLWNTGGTGSTIVGLPGGTYSVTVTDQTGCFTTCFGVVQGSEAPTCSITSNPENCGQNNGSATVTGFGGAGAYTYMWSNGATSSTAISLSAGTYVVTVTDAAGCTSTCSVNVGETSAPVCSTSSTNASCNLNGGTATVSAQGGVGGYTYLWSNGGTTSQIINVPAGNYSVTVTDAVGCSTSCDVIVGSDPLPVCTVSSSDATCGVNNGMASVTATGGSGGYTYAWSNGQSTATITGLLSGVYNVVVTDSNGCSTSCTVTVGEILPTTCQTVSTNTTCGESNGTATVIANGGIGNYTYLWSNGATTSDISNLQAGTYQVTVTDGNGCSSECEATVSNSGGGPVCNVTGVDATCGDPNGMVMVNITQGQAPFTYLWSTGGTGTEISGLLGGEYSVTVTDATGCSSVCSTTIESLGGPSVTVVTENANCGLSDGTATANAFGGNGLYTYLWSNGGTTPTIYGLAPGTYSVTVTDQKGCVVMASGSLENSQANCNAEVGNFVWNDADGDGIQDATESPIEGATVTLYDANTGNLVNQLITNSDGEYCFTGLIPGDYYIELTSLPISLTNYVATMHNPNLIGINSDITGDNGHWTTSTFSVILGEVNKSIDLGVYLGATIGNQVFCDNPLEGLPNLFDIADTPFAGVTVSLFSFDTNTGVATFVDSHVTDDSGIYLFEGLPAGIYYIEADVMAMDKEFVTANASYFDSSIDDYVQDDNIDSDITFLVLSEQMASGETHSVGRTNYIPVQAGDENLTIDIGLGETTVPIELFDFTGVWNDDEQQTELQWVTATEINTDFFGVERTRDLSEDFTEIGTVDAAGNSVDILYYGFNDTDIFESGTYYYRLRIVDLDGSYEYSKIVAVKVIYDERDQKISLAVYPNPVIEEITVDVTVEREAAFEGGIYDAIGQLIQKVNIDVVKAGRNAISIDINDLPVGTYVLRVMVDDKVLIEKISKTE
ncbi:MAG: T9SS type A sorting domain-containing protein, partial [Bacteroidia bacterium]|nr:T9SS type A sorting domain-containing protein [Bacteroidia bacterium]